jgi:CBS domain-containing protein
MESAAPSTGERAPIFAHATVADAMHPGILTCDPATPLVTIAQRMSAEHIHSIVMLSGSGDQGGRIPWAVVTDADLLRHAARADELTAGDVAGSEIVLAHPEEPLAEVAARMARLAVTHTVVVDEGTGRPAGVLSALDVARVLAWGRD